MEIGVRSETRPGTCTFVYTVLNRTQDTLTVVQIGYDTEREACKLTGARPHVPPDTAYAPPGWDCAPLQAEDPTTFTLGWKYQLQADLDRHMELYNRERSHQGYRTKGRSPYQAFLDGAEAMNETEVTPEAASAKITSRRRRDLSTGLQLFTLSR